MGRFASRSNSDVTEQTNPADGSGNGFPADLLVELRAGPGPIGERLERELRGAIQRGRLLPGTRLPPTRVLSAELRISRSVVVGAYGNLAIDGYLVARRGSGTVVAPGAGSPSAAVPRRRPHWFLGERGGRRATGVSLSGGLPDPALFPRARWLRHYRAALTEVPDRILTYPDVMGARALRRELAAYLARVRGLAVAEDDLLVCTGYTQGLTLICRALARAGATRIAMEDPCFALHRESAGLTGLRVVPVPVDDDGLDVSALAAAGDVAAVVAAPAHSYPLGATMSAERRRELLAWSTRTGAVIVEDDYDSEFRYDRAPIGALQGLAPDRVAYIGGVSKTLSPALRLGWLAVPPDLAEAVEYEKRCDDLGSPLLDQLALARMIAGGDFARHLRRVRPIYRERRDETIAALDELLPGARWRGEAAGLHLYVELPPGLSEQEVLDRAAERGLDLEAGAWHWHDSGAAAPSIVLGYGAAPPARIRRGVALLAEAVATVGA